MAKKEVKTDLWVAKQLDECGIKFDAQGSNTLEIDDALKTEEQARQDTPSTSLLSGISCWLSRIRRRLTSMSI